MTWKDALRIGGDVIVEMHNQQQIAQAREQFSMFLNLDRGATMQHISSIVQNASAEQMTEFEKEYLWLTTVLVDPNEIVRAVELWGWLKTEQHEYYGHWRGFVDEQ
jgi:hypothetical protein